MKKLAITIVILLSVFCSNAQTQSDSTNTQTANPEQLKLTEITLSEFLQHVEKNLYDQKPKYKLYSTENIYTHLKLNTATGQIWQVQCGVNVDDWEYALDDTSLLYSWEEEENGRFELYPTHNMYNFVLLDTKNGRVYQVQWSTKASERFRQRIW